jgi:uncharacterized protein (DUF934 family)
MKTQLIKNNALIENNWHFVLPEVDLKNIKKQAGKVVQFKVTGEQFPSISDYEKIILPECKKILIPLQLYLLKTDEIKNKYEEIGLWLYSHDELNMISKLKEDINDFNVIGIYIEKFADGRIYSMGNLLRQKYNFINDLRALGDILKDQLFFLRRLGFTSFLIKEGKDPEDALKGLGDFTYSYQGMHERGSTWNKEVEIE